MTRGIDGITRISNSELQTWLTCNRKWWFSYYRELAPMQREATGALALGTRVHFALAGYYSPEHLDPMETLERTIGEDISTFPEQVDSIEKEADLARAMIEGYVEWIKETGADDGLKIVGVEAKMEVPAAKDSHIHLIGKLDIRLVREWDDVQLFMDHKTVGNLTEPVRTLHMDPQMLMYHLIEFMDFLRAKETALEAGEPVPDERFTDGALYNMLRKVKRTATAKPPFYERVEVRHNMDELRNFWLRVMGTVARIEEAYAKLDSGEDHHYVVPPRPSRDCTWSCEFFPVCPLFDDGSNAEGLLEQCYVHTDPIARYAEVEAEGTAT